MQRAGYVRAWLLVAAVSVAACSASTFPVRHHPDGPLHVDNRCYNQLITALRAPAERGNALLRRWRALDRVTVCPQRIGAIATAALVLTSLDRGTR